MHPIFWQIPEFPPQSHSAWSSPTPVPLSGWQSLGASLALLLDSLPRRRPSPGRALCQRPERPRSFFEQGQVTNTLFLSKEKNPSDSPANHVNSFFSRIPPTGPTQAPLWTLVSWRQFPRMKVLCSCPKVLRESQFTLVPGYYGNLSVSGGGGQGAIPSLCTKRPPGNAWSELFCAALTLILWSPILASGKSSIVFVGFWNILSSPQAPDLVELKSCRGSRKCCAWCSFSVNVGCWRNVQL